MSPIDLIPPSFGSNLSERDYLALESSWIDRQLVDAAMLRRVDNLEGREVVGHKGRKDCAGIVFPYYWPGELRPFTYRLRRDNPEIERGSHGKSKLAIKYLAPPNASNRLYIPPGVTLEQLHDLKIPIVITEGEKKALALWRVSDHEVDCPRFIPIAVSGVWNWRGRVGKEGGPNGERLDVVGPIADLSRTAWKDREVLIVFDVNVHTNPSVQWARKKLSDELIGRGANVKFVDLPADCGVNGVDDLLAVWGPHRVLNLLKEARDAGRTRTSATPQFELRTDGMYRVTTNEHGITQRQLTTYIARITENIWLDDGAESRLEFEIDAELLGRFAKFRIPATEFARMDWPIEKMGAEANTFPNQREYARAAIQTMSKNVANRVIYTHTGWRSIDNQWVYLHGSGGIGRDGARCDVQVSLSNSLSKFELPIAGDTDQLGAGIQSSLRLAELAPSEIGFPLLAATFRAPLGATDFAIHLAGETGAFKSEVAALHQQHYGVGMDRVGLPASWTSTANSLEVLAFLAKDTLVVIDDFAPQGSGMDVAKLHAVAERVFRAAGNRSARSRLTANATLRESKPPRALILSTGEDVPRGQSVRARLLILELSRGMIDPAKLTIRQAHARQGLYAQCMSGYIQWIAGDYELIRKNFEATVQRYRAKALTNPAHARTPDIIANLQAGFELFLEFAVLAGAIENEHRTNLSNACWLALTDAAANQTKHQKDCDPIQRFFAILHSVLTSGRAHLAGREGNIPYNPQACGWRLNANSIPEPRGECIGWATDDDVFLEPASYYRILQMACHDIGETFPISESTLRRRLADKGFLKHTDQSRHVLTVRRSIAGSSKSVLQFDRATVLPELSEGDEDAE